MENTEKKPFIALERFLNSLMADYPDDMDYINSRLAELKAWAYGCDREQHEFTWDSELLFLAQIKCELIARYKEKKGSSGSAESGMMQEIPTDLMFNEPCDTSESLEQNVTESSVAVKKSAEKVADSKSAKGKSAKSDSAPTK